MEPEEVMEAIVVLNDAMDAEEQAENAAGRVVLPQQDAFALSDAKFRRLFRLSKELVLELIALLHPYLSQPSRTSALNERTKVLTALRFFASGSYQEITGSNCYIGVSQASVSRCVHEVCDALNQPAILNRFIKFPENIQQLQALRTRFNVKYRFPGIVGIIDCTHVAIVAPPRNHPEYPEHIYVNRKNYHSINVQLICDENLRILNVNARFPGSTHDAYIWRMSNISQTLEAIYRHERNNSFLLLGDSGYPLRPWLQTPLLAVEPNTPEERFNNRFKSIRSSIERCNGVLKNRFRYLLKHRVLHYAPPVASKIVNACAVLHNMCIDRNIPEPEIDDEVAAADFGMFHVEPDMRNVQGNVNMNQDLVLGRAIQRGLINNFN